MERFKVVERETKTKAYSKEGLGAAQKLDPAQKEKEEITSWLIQAIDALNLQVDQFESEIESLIAGGKKKRVDKDKQDRVDDLKSKVEKHRFHIKKLETILRMLDNMSVEVNQVKKIKDDIEYYIESSQDADFQENEYLYDDIEGIDEVELTGIAVAGSANTDSNGTPTSMTSSPTHMSPLLQQPVMQSIVNSMSVDMSTATVPTSEEKKKEKLSQSTPVTTSTSNNISSSMVVKPTPVRASSAGSVNSGGGSISVLSTPGSNISTSKQLQPQTPQQQQHLSATGTLMSTTTTTVTSNNNTMLTSKMSSVAHYHSSHSSHQHHNVSQATSTATIQSGNFATVAAANIQHHPATSTSYSNKIASVHLPTENGLPPYSTSSVSTNIVTSNATSGSGSGTQNPAVNFNEQHRLSSSPSLSVNSGPSPVPTNSTPPHLEQSTITPYKNLSQNQDSTDKVTHDMSQMDASRSVSNNRETMTTEVHIPPILGVAPLGLVPLTPEQQLNFRMMEAAYNHMPHPADSERLRPYLPRNPCTTPSYYPQTPLANADTLEYHAKLATDTLFFIFYYSEGTKSQYLAAKALKKQSWRFHTKYMMWFQRHEEPRTINEEYEQGTYIYFDYEKWTQRKKEGFTFEYKYLEDRELT